MISPRGVSSGARVVTTASCGVAGVEAFLFFKPAQLSRTANKLSPYPLSFTLT
jgi:hypothetical protein